MKNIPKWIFKNPKYVGHPSSVIKEAAKALDIRAHILKEKGMTEDAAITRKCRDILLEVANGATWAEALNIEVNRKNTNAEKLNGADSLI